MGFPRQEYRSGLPFLSPGDLPDTGIKPGSPALQDLLHYRKILYHLKAYEEAGESLEKKGRERQRDREEDVRARVLSRIQLLATAWTVACQAPLSMGFPRQEYWSGLPLPSPGDLPDPRIELESPAWLAYSLPLVPPGKPK